MAGFAENLKRLGSVWRREPGILSRPRRLDRDIAATGERFLETVSRLEAMGREQRDTNRKQSDLEEKARGLDGRNQELLQWLEAHAGGGKPGGGDTRPWNLF